MEANIKQSDGLTALKGLKFSHAVSLGSHCYTSTVFKRLGLNLYSCPFDWMFTTVPMVQACIESDFKQFLDPKYYEPVPWQGGTQYKHSFYDTYWQSNFSHFNPTTNEGYAYLVRCVERFRQVLASTAPTLFMFTTQIHPHQREEFDGYFSQLHSVIKSRRANASVVGVVVSMTGAQPGMEMTVQIGASQMFHYTSASLLQGIKFAADEDDNRFDQFVRTLTAL